MTPGGARERPLNEIESLPHRYASIVSAVMQSQRYMVWSAAASNAPEFFVFRNTEINTRIYLVSREGKVIFFFRRPETTEALLEAEVSFGVRPAANPLGLLPKPLEAIEAIQPPFFGSQIPPAAKQTLSRALKASVGDLVFIDLGTAYLAARNPRDITAASAAFMEQRDPEARVVFRRLLPLEPPRYSYEPGPFLRVIDRLNGWLTGKVAGTTAILPLNPDSDNAIPQILNSLVRAWESGRAAAFPTVSEDPLGAMMPEFAIAGYNAAVTLRLKPDGTLAERRQDDSFRLRMAFGDVAGRLRVTVGLPDFLGEGELYDRLVDAVRRQAVVESLFSQSTISEGQRKAFQRFLDTNRPVVFRAKKDGDTDTEVYVFRGLWDGLPKAVVASLIVKVVKSEDGFEVNARPSDAALQFHNFLQDLFAPSVELPRFLLSLVDQLNNWEQAFT